jgi:copper chaperone CopZ
MNCAGCEQRIRQALDRIADVQVVQISSQARTMTLRYRSVEALAFGLRKLAEVGYPAEPSLVRAC